MKTAEQFFEDWAKKNVEVKGGTPLTYELLPQQIFNFTEEYADECLRQIMDIAFQTGKLHQVDKNLTDEHWKEMKDYVILYKHKHHRK